MNFIEDLIMYDLSWNEPGYCWWQIKKGIRANNTRLIMHELYNILVWLFFS